MEPGTSLKVLTMFLPPPLNACVPTTAQVRSSSAHAHSMVFGQHASCYLMGHSEPISRLLHCIGDGHRLRFYSFYLAKPASGKAKQRADGIWEHTYERNMDDPYFMVYSCHLPLLQPTIKVNDLVSADDCQLMHDLVQTTSDMGVMCSATSS